MKYHWGRENPHTRRSLINKWTYRKIRNKFQEDIHNAKLFYHYELDRYHILTINLTGPVDNHYKLYRDSSKKHYPAGTFDLLIIGMGLHLVKIHGKDNVVIITSDDRINKIVNTCKKEKSKRIKEKLELDFASNFTGINFHPDSFPRIINFRNAKNQELIDLFGAWPLPVGKRVPSLFSD